MKMLQILILFCLAITVNVQEKPSKVVEDFKPASTNQPGTEYPQINSEGCVWARIEAPEANSVLLNIDGVRYPMTEDGNARDDTEWGNNLYWFVQQISK